MEDEAWNNYHMQTTTHFEMTIISFALVPNFSCKKIKMKIIFTYSLTTWSFDLLGHNSNLKLGGKMVLLYHKLLNTSHQTQYQWFITYENHRELPWPISSKYKASRPSWRTRYMISLTRLGPRDVGMRRAILSVWKSTQAENLLMRMDSINNCSTKPKSIT